MPYRPTFKKIEGIEFMNSIIKRQEKAQDRLVKSCFTPKKQSVRPYQHNAGWQFDNTGNMLYSI